MNRRAQERAAMEQALHHALERGELTLHYQPQITSDPVLALHGMEALARWSHPEWGQSLQRSSSHWPKKPG